MVLSASFDSEPFLQVPSHHGFSFVPNLTFLKQLSLSAREGKMDPRPILIMLTLAGVSAFLAYSLRALLAISQNREDRDDEALWHYLLSPR